jgi:hypothetical protein
VSALVYQIPLARLEAFRGRALVVRTDRPSDLVAAVRPNELRNLAYVQLNGQPTDTDVLVHWAEGLPIELLLDEPERDFPSLYRFTKLLDNHPVRVAIPVAPGFEKAVKLASSLEFIVRLQIGQPAPPLIAAMARVLDDYLHRSTITQPIEPFHSLLIGYCRDEPVDLWAIQEEDPALIRTIDEQGRERLPGRLSSLVPGLAPEQFVADWASRLSADGAECRECPFFSACRGYFKWPERDYDCAGVKDVLTALKQAAEVLRADLAAAAPPPGARP